MAKKKTATRKRDVVRMNLEMSPKVRERLETLSEESDLSLSEVVRKSLAVYDLLWGEIQAGGSIVIRNGKHEKEVVIV